jgi:hypothetical protein
MFIPDPTFFHPGSRILIKEFKYFNPKKSKKWFLSFKRYDPGCSTRIPDPDADFLPSRIPDPGVKKAPNPGPRIRIRNTEKWVDVAQNNSGVGCLIREYGVLMLGDNPETGEDVALKLVQEGFAKVRLRFRFSFHQCFGSVIVLTDTDP